MDRDVITFLTFGWPLNYTRDASPRMDKLRNHKGARDYADYITEFLAREVGKGRIMGPFSEPPFPDFMVSPLNTVPKADDESQRRVIVDLSWPLGESVNSGIEIELYLGQVSDLHFPTVDDIITLIHRAGPSCFIYKLDLKAAYRQFPVDPRDYRLLGYFWNGAYYYDTVLCMGQRTAALACQRSTRAVVYMHMKRGHPALVYIDDFIGVDVESRAWEGFYDLRELLRELGLVENQEKAVLPSQRQICLGIEFDTVAMTMSVSEPRLREIRSLLSEWLTKRSATQRELQSLIGKLMFISKCVRQSRPFMNRLLSVLRGLRKPHYRIKLTRAFQKDLYWWSTFATVFNGVSILPGIDWSAPDSVFATDACLRGCGGVRDKTYFHACFPRRIVSLKLPIHDLELLAVVVAVKLWKDEIAGQRVLIYCDNEPSVCAINSGRASQDFTAAGLRELWLTCSLYQIELRAVHLPGCDNRLPDFLSRWDLNEKYKFKFLQEIDESYREVLVTDNHFVFDDGF